MSTHPRVTTSEGPGSFPSSTKSMKRFQPSSFLAIQILADVVLLPALTMHWPSPAHCITLVAKNVSGPFKDEFPSACSHCQSGPVGFHSQADGGTHDIHISYISLSRIGNCSTRGSAKNTYLLQLK